MSAINSDREGLVLFDLDGTITDSAPGILNALQYAFTNLRKIGFEIPEITNEDLKVHLGPPLHMTFQEVFNLSSEDCQIAINYYREYYHDSGMYESQLYEGILGVIEKTIANNLLLAISTSKMHTSAETILQHFDLAHHFAFIGGDDAFGTRNSKSKVIGHTLNQLQVKNIDFPIVMIGDRKHDVIGALEHSIPTIGVLWGYGSIEELSLAGAAAIVADISDLPTHIDLILNKQISGLQSESTNT